MINIIKTSKFVSVTLDDGSVLVKDDTSQEFVASIMGAANDDIIRNLFSPQTKVSKQLNSFVKGEFESNYIELRDGNRAIIPSISEITVPQDFVNAILDAETNGDKILLETYLNFWTLVSLNPDAAVRKNIFWYIKKWDVKLTHSGLLIAYRNVDSLDTDISAEAKWQHERVTGDYLKVKGQKKSPKNFHYEIIGGEGEELKYNLVDGKKQEAKGIAWKLLPNLAFDGKTLDTLYTEAISNTKKSIVYTDHHTHTFTIKIGQPVSMPRESVDANQENECSAGLYV